MFRVCRDSSVAVSCRVRRRTAVRGTSIATSLRTLATVVSFVVYRSVMLSACQDKVRRRARLLIAQSTLATLDYRPVLVKGGNTGVASVAYAVIHWLCEFTKCLYTRLAVYKPCRMVRVMVS